MNKEEDYILLETKKLKLMSKSELQEIIFKYDQEVDFLRKELEAKFVRYCELSEAQDQVEFLKNTNQILSQELLSSHKEKRELEHKLANTENCTDQLHDTKKEKEDGLSQSNYQPDTELVMLKLKVDTLKSDKAFLRTKIHKIQEEMDEMTERNNKLIEENNKLKFRIDSFELEIKTVKETLLNKNLATKEALKELQNKLQKKKHKIQELKSEILEVRQSRRDSEENLRENLKELEEEIKDLNKELTDKKDKIKRFESYDNPHEKNLEEINETRKENDKLRQKCETLTNKNEQMVKKLIDLKHRQVNSKQEIMKLNHKLNVCSEPGTPVNTNRIIKRRLEMVFKELIETIRHSNPDSQEVYLLTPDEFETIEQRINELISMLHDDILEPYNQFCFDLSLKSPIKEESFQLNDPSSKIKKYSTFVVNK